MIYSDILYPTYVSTPHDNGTAHTDILTFAVVSGPRSHEWLFTRWSYGEVDRADRRRVSLPNGHLFPKAWTCPANHLVYSLPTNHDYLFSRLFRLNDLNPRLEARVCPAALHRVTNVLCSTWFMPS
jgi:hypothetical protein